MIFTLDKFLDKTQSVILKYRRCKNNKSGISTMDVLRFIHPWGKIVIIDIVPADNFILTINYKVGDIELSEPIERLMDTYYMMERIGK